MLGLELQNCIDFENTENKIRWSCQIEFC